MKNIFSLSLIALLLFGCAGALMKSDSDDVDLVEIFSSEESETLDKFKTTDSELEKPTAPPISSSIEEKRIGRVEKAKEKVVKAKPVVKETPKVKVNPQESEDYPKVFLNFDKESQKYWDSYRPIFFEGEEFKYEISWSIFKAGIATISTQPMAKIGEKEVLHVNALLESAEYFEGIYKLKDTLDVYVDADKGKFSSLKYEMKQRESGQIVDDLQLFDHDELKTYFFYNRLKKGKTKKVKKVEYLPRYFTDSFSALYFIRGIPMKIGTSFDFPIITRGKAWLLKATVDDIENITVMEKSYKAYKITAQTEFPGVLKKSGDINFWISTDESRTVLKFSAKVKIGTVKGELISHKAGKDTGK
ncbi:PF11306 family protein [Bacteriovorax sp. BAL6_X]|uniref:DUF3108 domain-containing protein n=1 Tax=Bacteriovorax sp. BAL6_X TaxID=1201290 RepID=UPI000385FB79|nr:DUF3108 domain-containing protein [Bacteriovorax sp. BAL6_X]EPZ49875.1 PF11306 family protein [Bacteriovorax sp. BAL6_X]